MAPDVQPSRDSLACYRTPPCDGGGAALRAPRSRWRAALRPSVIAMIASAAALAPAQAQFTSITDFDK
jgi:hypothetical protein